MYDPYGRLERLGLKLPEVSSPGGSYRSVNVRAGVAYVAIQFPIWNETYRFRGHLGGEVTSEQGYEAMQLCALNVLAQIDAKVGFDRILGLNHLDASYQHVAGWDEGPRVVNGASDLFSDVLGERGQHSRTISGVASLPRGFSVGLTASFTLLEEG